VACLHLKRVLDHGVKEDLASFGAEGEVQHERLLKHFEPGAIESLKAAHEAGSTNLLN
jgi:hypothetical protein